jgi:HPt (histidine-containing phosphotransfer) domain-containing protein
MRKLVLAALVAAVGVFTVGVFVLVNRIFANFGPGVKADLEWKATRGARELAQASELGLAAGDGALVQKEFDAFRASDDVVAIVATGAGGNVIASFRESPEKVEQLFAGPPGTVRRTPGYYVAWAQAQIEGAVVGRLALVISTRRLVDSQRLLRQIEMIVGVGAGLGLLFGGLFVIYFTGAVIKRDAQLADHAANLERKVEERTAELDERNRGMRLVLDNVVQGFITIGLDGVMTAERSAVVSHWFGESAEGATLPDALAQGDTRAADWLRLGLQELVVADLPDEVILEQLPKQAKLGTRALQIEYTPLRNGESIERLLVVLTDVTAEVERERIERQQRELLALFQAISADRSGFLAFLEEGRAIVERIRRRGAESREVEQRHVHTLKGNASLYRLENLVAICHDAESHMIDEGAELSDAHRAGIVAAWDAMRTASNDLLGDNVTALVLDVSDHEALLAAVRAGASSDQIERVLRSWQLEPVKMHFERLARQARLLAERLGKAPPEIRVDAGGLRLDAKRWAGFWSSFVHVVRNGVDHGIEAESERLRRGKPPGGALWMTAEIEQGHVVIRVQDDGAGIDWDKLAARAAERGLPRDSREALENALFVDGVTTRDEATVTSGRGIGMAAVKQTVQALGGEIAVRSESGVGTVFEFRFSDPDVFQGPRSERVVRPSLRSPVPPTATGATRT